MIFLHLSAIIELPTEPQQEGGEKIMRNKFGQLSLFDIYTDVSDRHFQAILPIRGKIFNVESVGYTEEEKIAMAKEIKQRMYALFAVLAHTLRWQCRQSAQHHLMATDEKGCARYGT